MTALFTLNLLLPGSGLLVRGRLLPGLILLAPVPLLAALLLGAGIVAAPPVAAPIRLAVCSAWALLALLAALVWWWTARRTRFDPAAVRAAHRQACAAWLQGRPEQALTGAQELVRLAPEEAGAWGFLALVGESAGQPALAERARRRERRLRLEG